MRQCPKEQDHNPARLVCRSLENEISIIITGYSPSGAAVSQDCGPSGAAASQDCDPSGAAASQDCGPSGAAASQDRGPSGGALKS